MKNRVIYTLTCLLFVSCGNMFTRGEDKYFYLSDYTKKIADFKEGSYWIYRCDKLNTYDTVTAKGYEQGLEKEPFDSHYNYYEYIHITFFSSFHECGFMDRLSAEIYSEHDGYKRSYTDCSSENDLGFYLDIVKEGYLEGPRLTNYDREFDLNGKNITNIVCYSSTNNDTLKYKYYFAPDYGVVMMEHMNDSTLDEWKLVECNIEK